MTIYPDGEIPEEDKSVVETVCLNCVFAEWEAIDCSGEWGEQCGCAFDIVPRMVEQGAVVVSREDEEQKLRYCSIVDRVCVYCRPHKGWGDRLGKDVDAKSVARHEVTPRMGFIVVSDGDPAKLQGTLESISNMTMKPHMVTVQFKNSKLSPTEALNMLSVYMGPHRIQNRIDYIMEANATDMRIVDIAYKKIPQSYFASFEAGFIIPPDFIEAIDKALNDDLERFLLLKPISGINGMVAQSMVTKQIGGSNEDLIYNKLERVAEKQECQHLIRPATDLIPSLNSQS